MLVTTPKEFSFQLCLDFLQRSPKELLHQLTDRSVTKALRINDTRVVFSVTPHNDALDVSFLTPDPDAYTTQAVADYIREWFDLDQDLKPFYKMATKDRLLKDIVSQYYGYRIVGQPDLFESLVWAVLGQQINLGFAYSLKQRFVQRFGEKLVIDDQVYHLFPTPETVALIAPHELSELQFSTQKSRYTIAIAQAFADGTLSKARLKPMSLADAKHELMKIKGVGNWTANYALMKTFRHPDAFPLEDAGLHNAIKKLRGMDRKPTLDEVTKIFRKYRGWEAYATLYLWKAL